MQNLILTLSTAKLLIFIPSDTFKSDKTGLEFLYNAAKPKLQVQY